ncbi:MAG: DUF86 domain-containing protein [Nitrospiraceae bacterium]|nr:MAG: DUF86 domain-containing protein [Nitrospiraceae bacterium]
MKRSARLYINDILEYMDRAENYVMSFSFEAFCKEEKTCDAVIRCIEVIGEAVKNIPETIRNQYPLIPWREIAGMRDKIIHAYFAVDFETVWLVVKEEIPRLKPHIKQVLKDLNNSTEAE